MNPNEKNKVVANKSDAQWRQALAYKAKKKKDAPVIMTQTKNAPPMTYKNRNPQIKTKTTPNSHRKNYSPNFLTKKAFIHNLETITNNTCYIYTTKRPINPSTDYIDTFAEFRNVLSIFKYYLQDYHKELFSNLEIYTNSPKFSSMLLFFVYNTDKFNIKRDIVITKTHLADMNNHLKNVLKAIIEILLIIAPNTDKKSIKAKLHQYIGKHIIEDILNEISIDTDI